MRRKAIRSAARPTGAAVIDPYLWLCTKAGICPVVVGNTLVYRDDSHMAKTFSEAIGPRDRLSALLDAAPRERPGPRTEQGD
jgi:hypothetical protein